MKKDCLTLHKNGVFDLAEKMFISALWYVPNDGPPKVFAEMCSELKNNPPVQ